MTELLFEFLAPLVFWVVVIIIIVRYYIKTRNNRPVRGGHPTTVNRPSSGKGPVLNGSSGGMRPGSTVSSDGHRIPPSKDITCEGQYGHTHGETGPRYIVHEEPTTGYCNLNGKIVALKDCWKY